VASGKFPWRAPFNVDYLDNPYSFYPSHTQADMKRTKNELGFTPQFTLAIAIGIADDLSRLERL